MALSMASHAARLPIFRAITQAFGAGSGRSGWVIADGARKHAGQNGTTPRRNWGHAHLRCHNIRHIILCCAIWRLVEAPDTGMLARMRKYPACNNRALSAQPSSTMLHVYWPCYDLVHAEGRYTCMPRPPNGRTARGATNACAQAGRCQRPRQTPRPLTANQHTITRLRGRQCANRSTSLRR